MTYTELKFKITSLFSRRGNRSIKGAEVAGILNDLTDKIKETGDIANSTAKSLIWQAPVADFASLSATYPAPQPGWAAMVQSEGVIYSYNGNEWKSTGLKAFPEDVALKGGTEKTLKEVEDDLVQLAGKLFTIPGYIHKDDGLERFSTQRFRTDFLDISNSEKIEVFGGSNNSLLALITYYDENKNYISSVFGLEYNAVKVVIDKSEFPEGAKYIRCSSDLDVSKSYVKYIDFSTVAKSIESINDSIVPIQDRVDALSEVQTRTFNIVNDTPVRLIASDSTPVIQTLYAAGFGTLVTPAVDKIVNIIEMMPTKVVHDGYFVFEIYDYDNKEVISESRMSISDWNAAIGKTIRVALEESVTLVAGKQYVVGYTYYGSSTINYYRVSKTDELIQRLRRVSTDAEWAVLAGDYAVYLNLLHSSDYEVVKKIDVEAKYVSGLAEEIEKQIQGDDNRFEIILPDTITAVVGDNLQIFKKSILKAYNPSFYNVEFVSSVGKNYKRYYELNPTDAGAKTLTVNIRDKGKVVASKTATLNVVQPPTSPTTNKNILVIGASAASNGYFASELKRRLTETTGDGTPLNPTGLGLNNISFVGRKNGTAKNIPLEATGGWSWVTFTSPGELAYRFQVSGITQLQIGDIYENNGTKFTITEINVTDGSGNIRCTYEGTQAPLASGTLTKISGDGDAVITYTSQEQEAGNPFWNAELGRLDFINYANQYCNGNIDYMISHAGSNDIYGAGRTTEQIIDSIKDFARQFHLDFPDAKFLVTSLPLPNEDGSGANYGAKESYSYGVTSVKFQDLAIAMNNLSNEAEFADYLFYVPVLEQFDSDNGFPVKEVNVNNRVAVLESRGTNALHPTPQGAYMVADAIYRAVCSVLATI